MRNKEKKIIDDLIKTFSYFTFGLNSPLGRETSLYSLELNIHLIIFNRSDKPNERELTSEIVATDFPNPDIFFLNFFLFSLQSELADLKATIVPVMEAQWLPAEREFKKLPKYKKKILQNSKLILNAAERKDQAKKKSKIIL